MNCAPKDETGVTDCANELGPATELHHHHVDKATAAASKGRLEALIWMNFRKTSRGGGSKKFHCGFLR